jgi:hypothetical protein
MTPNAYVFVRCHDYFILTSQVSVAHGCDKILSMAKIIYALVDTSEEESRIFYVGMTTKPAKERFKAHINEAKRGVGKVDTKKNRKVMKLLKTENLDMIILEENDGWTNEELAQKEIWWISSLRFTGVQLTNLTDGGDGTAGYKYTEEQKRAIRVAIAKAYEERGESIRQQMSDSSRKRWDNTDERVAQSQKMKDSKAAKEHRKVLHKNSIGRKLDEEHKKAISKGTKDFFDAHPEIGHSHSKRMKKKFEDLVYKEMVAERTKAAFQDPARRDMLIENRRRAGAITNSMAVSCADCGITSTPGPLGVHLKATGHKKK